jgi:hypothetical protein
VQPSLIPYPELLDRLPPAARELIAAAWPSASRGLPAEAQRGLLEGVQLMLDARSGMGPVVTYLRTVPEVLRTAGFALLPAIVGVGLSVLQRADARTLDLYLEALPQASRRLVQPGALHGYLDLVDELSELAPDGLAALFERLGRLLDQLSLDGLRRWALLGVQAHTGDPAQRDAWFRLESRDAQAILRAASEGTLFAEVERRLGFYLRALWARAPELRPLSASQDSKRGKRVSIVNDAIRMPPAFEVFPGQSGAALYRAAAAHAAAHLVYSTQQFPMRALRPIQVALVSLIEDARVERLAMLQLPGLCRLWQAFHVALPSFTVSAVSLMARLSRALIDERYADDNPFVQKGRRMFAEAAARLNDQQISREIGNLLGNDLGQMRVQFNFKTYVIEPLYRDDNLFLWDLGDARQAPAEEQETIQQAVKLEQQEGGEQSEAQLDDDTRAEGEPDQAQLDAARADDAAGIEELLAQPYLYDEWDYLIGLDRPAWCTLFEKPPALGDPHAIDQVLRRNEDTLNRLTSLIKAVQVQRPRRLRRQLDGDRLDLDACIDATVDLRVGRTPDPRVHQRLGRNSRDLAVLVLLDLSQSTNDWVPSAGTSVLNLAREATALVAHAMDQLGDDFAIHGFDSNGRHEVEYYRFKDFDEPYGELARARLAGMRGQLSTRMGTALRHAGRFLRTRHCAHRLILLITDGEPHDIDVHDKQYLMFDAKRAVEDQRRHGVSTFCLSLDPAADQYVTRIFGARNYLVLDQLRRLPEKLPALYLRLTR